MGFWAITKIALTRLSSWTVFPLLLLCLAATLAQKRNYKTASYNGVMFKKDLMKYLAFAVILIGSIGATYKITFDMTQEVVGALYIQGIINDHKAHQKLVEALRSGDDETVEKISNGMVAYNVDLLQTLVSSLEGGRYYRFTKGEVNKGREYLDNIPVNINE